jgi:hypothetical protein
MARTLFLACMASLAITAEASAEFVYHAERQGWYVYNGSGGCYLQNRNPIEFNVNPLNALVVHMEEPVKPQLRVWFWPGALTGEISAVTFKSLPAAAEGPFTVPAARNGEWDEIATSAPLPDALLKLLTDTRIDVFMLEVEVPDTKAKQTFAMQGSRTPCSRLPTAPTATRTTRKSERRPLCRPARLGSGRSSLGKPNRWLAVR